ncbi:hypothetical protein BJ973_007467 [Actinoplanes tereljensis]|uniref:Uncharacterized protein n=1 Tax=Paractinoplanes tereljensis TaxID=571912 RepID=A0A919NVW5_9ACTN|nr:hypothetical protein [Actinoplanes tereljensis]GIF25215.1 hypothetical protein Ate02nite_79450 [Actinoplanes tereljensis]
MSDPATPTAPAASTAPAAPTAEAAPAAPAGPAAEIASIRPAAPAAPAAGTTPAGPAAAAAAAAASAVDSAAAATPVAPAATAPAAATPPAPELKTNITAGQGGVMTDEVGVVTGDLTLQTEVSGNEVTVRVQYQEADEWYAVTGAKASVKDPADAAAIHQVVVGILNRPEEG